MKGKCCSAFVVGKTLNTGINELINSHETEQNNVDKRSYKFNDRKFFVFFRGHIFIAFLIAFCYLVVTLKLFKATYQLPSVTPRCNLQRNFVIGDSR